MTIETIIYAMDVAKGIVITDTGVYTANIPKCDDCGATTPDVYDITTMAPFYVPPEYLCENCAEARYDRIQESREP